MIRADWTEQLIIIYLLYSKKQNIQKKNERILWKVYYENHFTVSYQLAKWTATFTT